jgi:hypothetical protein
MPRWKAKIQEGREGVYAGVCAFWKVTLILATKFF